MTQSIAARVHEVAGARPTRLDLLERDKSGAQTHVATLEDGRRLLVTDSVIRDYVPDVDGELPAKGDDNQAEPVSPAETQAAKPVGDVADGDGRTAKPATAKAPAGGAASKAASEK